MQSLNDDERKDILGEVLSSELQAILEYVKDMPALRQELHQVHATVDNLSERFTVVEHAVRGQETDLTTLKRKLA